MIFEADTAKGGRAGSHDFENFWNGKIRPSTSLKLNKATEYHDQEIFKVWNQSTH